MKTFLRAILASVLLVFSLVAVLRLPLAPYLAGLLAPASTAVETTAVTQQQTAIQLVTFGLVAVAGVLADALVSFLVPMKSPGVRRVLHALGMAGVYMSGLAVLGAVEWQDPGGASRSADWLRLIPGVSTLMDSGLLDPTVVWPFLIVAVIGFAGYVLVSLIVRPVPRLSRVLANHLTEGEEVLCNIQQTRWKQPVTPDSMVATNRRVIVYSPTNLGFTSTVEDYNYVDISNIKNNRGWLFASVSLQQRFEGDDLVLHDLPKSRADAFTRVVSEQLRLARSQVPLGPTPGPSAGASADPRRSA
jgi:hypothetical protein